MRGPPPAQLKGTLSVRTGAVASSTTRLPVFGPMLVILHVTVTARSCFEAKSTWFGPCMPNPAPSTVKDACNDTLARLVNVTCRVTISLSGRCPKSTAVGDQVSASFEPTATKRVDASGQLADRRTVMVAE